jgi:hypothetical protein
LCKKIAKLLAIFPLFLEKILKAFLQLYFWNQEFANT